MVFAILIFAGINYGVKYRVYANHIKYGRRLEFGDKLNIDLDDVSSYPKPVFELWQEKQKYDAHIKRKEEKMTKTEDNFHKYVETRILSLKEHRAKSGLKT